MSSIKCLFLGVILAACSTHLADATTVFFDYGDTNSPTSAGDNYNNVLVGTPTLGAPQPVVLANTIDSTGAGTGIGLSLSGFYHGPNPNGTLAPSGAAATFTASATRDSVFTHTVPFGTDQANPKGAIVLTGLNDSTSYDFTFFASRTGVGDNREAKYTVTGGSSTSALLNASNNVSNVATISGMFPSAGSITINVEAGPNNNNGSRFAYLGAMRLEYTAVPEPTTVVLLGLSGLGLLFRRHSARPI